MPKRRMTNQGDATLYVETQPGETVFLEPGESKILEFGDGVLSDLAEKYGADPTGVRDSAPAIQAAYDVVALQARIRALEAGLAEYGQHTYKCEVMKYTAQPNMEGIRRDPPCTCGLAALAGES